MDDVAAPLHADLALCFDRCWLSFYREFTSFSALPDLWTGVFARPYRLSWQVSWADGEDFAG